VPGYLGIDKQKLTITYLREPTPEEVERKINLGSVTEWYSRKRSK
jgi:hypothetical protein